jgi:UDP-glucose 4-epimerase
MNDDDREVPYDAELDAPAYTVLITGGAGLVGRHLSRALAGARTDEPQPRPIRVVSTSHRLDGLDPAVPEEDRIVLDLARPIDMGTLPARVDAVVHLAQSSRYREFPAGVPDMFAINVASTQALLEYARAAGATRFVHASTGSVYAASSADLDEGSPLAATPKLGYYPATKLAAEQLVAAYASELGTTILRPFFVYGSGQRDSMLVPRLVTSVREGRPLTLQGEDGMVISPCHVDDAVAAIRAAISPKLRPETHHLLNLAGPEAVSLRQIGEAIGALVGRAPIFERAPGATAPRLVASTARLTAALGAPRVGLAEGLARSLGEAE